MVAGLGPALFAVARRERKIVERLLAVAGQREAVQGRGAQVGIFDLFAERRFVARRVQAMERAVQQRLPRRGGIGRRRPDLDPGTPFPGIHGIQRREPEGRCALGDIDEYRHQRALRQIGGVAA